MLTGIVSILAATLCWGFVFVIPIFLVGFDPIEVTLGRFFFFGLISLIILLLKKRRLFHHSYSKHWVKAFWFGLMSTLVCYSGMVFCMRYASPAITALIYGISPITIALFGNWQKKEYRYRDFLFPGILTIFGISLTNLKAFEISTVSLFIYSLGFLCGLLGLSAWTWYAVRNVKFQAENPHLSTLDWVVMLGAATFSLCVIIAVIIALLSPDLSKYASISPELKTFLVGSLILGSVSSWLAFFLWNKGTLYVPISLAGQLTIFETIFGLLFIFLAETRLPSLFEFIGIIALLAGVLTAFKTLKKRGSKTA